MDFAYVADKPIVFALCGAFIGASVGYVLGVAQALWPLRERIVEYLDREMEVVDAIHEYEKKLDMEI